MTDLPKLLDATYWAQRKAQEELPEAEPPDDIKDSIAKWDRVVECLADAHDRYHDHDDQDGFRRAIRALMQAYDDWLG